MRDWEKKVTEILVRLAKDEADIAYLFNPIVTFPDALLDMAVRSEIGIPIGDIRQSDLNKFSTFSSNFAGITNLSGMEYWTSLTNLDLSFNSIRDLTPLSRLTALTKLHLSHNSIVYLTPLSGLTALTILYCDNNSIIDLSPLSGITGLEILFILANNIVDISPLAGLTALTTLNSNANNITDISSLIGVMASGNLDIGSNPLNVAAYHTDIPAIQATGVIVIFDPEPMPAAIAIAPTGGTTAGGDAVDITGIGFLDGATATIDGNPCTSVVFVSSTEITAVTPAGTIGAKDVVVTNDVQFGTAVAAFLYT